MHDESQRKTTTGSRLKDDPLFMLMSMNHRMMAKRIIDETPRDRHSERDWAMPAYTHELVDLHTHDQLHRERPNKNIAGNPYGRQNDFKPISGPQGHPPMFPNSSQSHIINSPHNHHNKFDLLREYEEKHMRSSIP